jgi:hypothetical protein
LAIFKCKIPSLGSVLSLELLILDTLFGVTIYWFDYLDWQGLSKNWCIDVMEWFID